MSPPLPPKPKVPPLIRHALVAASIAPLGCGSTPPRIGPPPDRYHEQQQRDQQPPVRIGAEPIEPVRIGPVRIGPPTPDPPRIGPPDDPNPDKLEVPPARIGPPPKPQTVGIPEARPEHERERYPRIGPPMDPSIGPKDLQPQQPQKKQPVRIGARRAPESSLTTPPRGHIRTPDGALSGETVELIVDGHHRLITTTEAGQFELQGVVRRAVKQLTVKAPGFEPTTLAIEPEMTIKLVPQKTR